MTLQALRPHSQSRDLVNDEARSYSRSSLDLPRLVTDIELVVRSLGCHPAKACNVVITTTSGFFALDLSAHEALFREFHPSVRSCKHGKSDLPSSRRESSELIPLPFRSLARLFSPKGLNPSLICRSVPKAEQTIDLKT